MMRHLMFLTLAMAFSMFNPATPAAMAQEASDIVGIWQPSEGTSYIKIFKQKGEDVYFGKIVWLKEPNDDNGKPKVDKDGKALMNMVNLRDFVFKKGVWTDGTIYDPKTGNTYYCTIEMKNPDKLEVRGSIDAMGIVGRTDVWVRMKKE